LGANSADEPDDIGALLNKLPCRGNRADNLETGHDGENEGKRHGGLGCGRSDNRHWG